MRPLIIVKLFVLSVILLILVGGGFFSFLIARMTGGAQPEPLAPPAAARTAPVFDPADAPPRSADRLRLYRIVVGETGTTYGQFFSGNDGWVGARGVFRAGLGRRQIRVPVQVMVITHPDGVVLVDAGLSPAMNDPAAHYSVFEGGFNALFWNDAYNHVAPGQDLTSQLAELDIRPADVRRIVLSHLHEDHVGELARFPAAEVLVSRAEWDDRERIAYAPSFSAARIRTFEFDSGPFFDFAGSKDLMGDGTILLLPAPGHTMGHTIVLVRLGKRYALLTGDGAYSLRHLDPDSLAAFNYFGPRGLATAADSIRKMTALQKQLPGLFFVPAHDLFDYGRVLLTESLRDGRLNRKEYKRLRAYQDSLYDERGRLREAARPRWQGDDASGRLVSDIP